MARSIGLTRPQMVKLIIIPQALRVIIPPTISQYLNLTKNSSLAMAVGYESCGCLGKYISKSNRSGVNYYSYDHYIFRNVQSIYIIHIEYLQ